MNSEKESPSSSTSKRLIYGALILLIVFFAFLLHYDAILYLAENTSTGKIKRNQIKAPKVVVAEHQHDEVVKPIYHEKQQLTSSTDSTAAADAAIDDHNAQQQQQQQAEGGVSSSLLLSVKPRNPTSSDSVNEFIQHRSLNGRILLIPVNSGYLDFGLNLLCSLEAISSTLVSTDEHPLSLFHHLMLMHNNNNNNNNNKSVDINSIGIGYSFVAMDEQVEKDLIAMRLPVFRDPDMPFVSSKTAEWANPKFHHLVCTKLFPVLRALKLSLSVVLSDADIVFRKDPLKYFLNRNHLDMIFSIGSCHRDLPDNHDLQSGDHLAKLNTGFYIVKPSSSSSSSSSKHQKQQKQKHDNDKVVQLFSDALKRCLESNSNNKAEAGEGDQPAMNAVLDNNIRTNNNNKPNNNKVHYGFFDGCLFANGCVYFKHLCANSSSLDPASQEAISLLKKGGKMPHVRPQSTSFKWESLGKNYVRRDDPVMVHANFIVGKKEKVKHLQKFGLWDAQCIASLKQKIV